MTAVEYDVIIVGAGPSGSTCAYNIKRLYGDARVLLIDQATFPRYKPCGGGISPEAKAYVDFDLLPAIDYVCRDIVMVANKKEIETREYPLWMVRRDLFDDYLVKQAEKKGVTFLSQTTVQHVVSEKEGVRVETNNGHFTAQYAVLAEGGKGRLAKKLGIDPNNSVLAALEYEHYTDQLNGKLYIDFDYSDTGYAWNFPKSNGLSCGIGGLIKGKNKEKVGLPQRLRDYMQQYDVKMLDKKNLHGHPIQIYSGRKKLVHDRIALIGEIAGCVDPLTAEGIRPAMKSGYLAAEAISKALASQKIKDFQSYDKHFHQLIGRDMRYASYVAYFLNHYKKQVLPLLSKKTAVNGFMSVFSGEKTYREKVSLRRLVQFVWAACVK